MPTRDILVIGASAGGIPALTTLCARLPDAFPAAIFVVSHMSPYGESKLPEILARAGPLPAKRAEDGEAIRCGQIYVAPPDYHLLLEADTVRLTRGPKEHRTRPAVDPLFRSAASRFGPRVIGLILSGMLSDGTAGMWAIKDQGGLAVVQDPLEAEQPSMPESVLANVATDYRVSVRQMATLLTKLVRESAPEERKPTMTKALQIETAISLGHNALQSGVLNLGSPSLYTCPDCHGTLLEIKEGHLIRYRCHTGHAFSAESLLTAEAASVQDALWNAMRTLEESTLLLRQLAHRAHVQQNEALAHRLEQQANVEASCTEAIQQTVLALTTPPLP